MSMSAESPSEKGLHFFASEESDRFLCPDILYYKAVFFICQMKIPIFFQILLKFAGNMN